VRPAAGPPRGPWRATVANRSGLGPRITAHGGSFRHSRFLADTYSTIHRLSVAECNRNKRISHRIVLRRPLHWPHRKQGASRHQDNDVTSGVPPCGVAKTGHRFLTCGYACGAFQVPDRVKVTEVQWTAASGFGSTVQWDVRG
jgi:hypothetical protein